MKNIKNKITVITLILFSFTFASCNEFGSSLGDFPKELANAEPVPAPYPRT